MIVLDDETEESACKLARIAVESVRTWRARATLSERMLSDDATVPAGFPSVMVWIYAT